MVTAELRANGHRHILNYIIIKVQANKALVAMPKKAKRKAAAVAPAVSLAASGKAKRKMQKGNVVVKQDAVARPTLLRLGLERIDWGHRFLGSHGEEYEAASRQLNYLRERNRDDKLDAQAMYDAFAKLDCLVRAGRH